MPDYYREPREHWIGGVIRNALQSYILKKKMEQEDFEEEFEQKIREAAAERDKRSIDLAEKKFGYGKKQDIYKREQEARKRLKPTILGSEKLGYHQIHPDQYNVGGQQIRGRREEILPGLQQKPEEAKFSITTPEGAKISGPASAVQPYIEQYGMEQPGTEGGGYSADQARIDKRAEEVAKSMFMSTPGNDETLWTVMPYHQKQQWIQHAERQIQAGQGTYEAPRIGADTTFVRPSGTFAPQMRGQMSMPGEGPPRQQPGQQGDPIEQARQELKAEGYTDEQINQALMRMGLMK